MEQLMRVRVEWIDGTVRSYDDVHTVELSREGRLLMMYGYRSGGRTPHIATVPLTTVRQYQQSGN